MNNEVEEFLRRAAARRAQVEAQMRAQAEARARGQQMPPPSNSRYPSPTLRNNSRRWRTLRSSRRLRMARPVPLRRG